MTITFSGLASVLDRTLFTDHGPIVKRPLPILTGAGLTVLSAAEVSLPTASLTPSAEGKLLTVFGSPDGRNDGTFTIARVLSPTRLRLADSSLDATDVALTAAAVVAAANGLKRAYNLHRAGTVAHGTADAVNAVVVQDSLDLVSAVPLLNDLRAKLLGHLATVSGSPPVHKAADALNVARIPAASSLAGAVLLVNDLRRSYEAHRQDLDFHLASDSANRAPTPPVRPTVGSGPLAGPFTWTLADPRYGTVADDPSDVEVRVNGAAVSVDAVFGLLGAVVLSVKPNPGDDVRVDYDWMENPPAKFKALNSSEYVLNQDGNRPMYGLPGHQYRARSYLADPSEYAVDLQSAVAARRVGWKYKAFERAQTAVLNDPTSLLLNVPSNRLTYPVLEEIVPEVTVRYDPVTLPQGATDPWIYSGFGTLSLASGGSELAVTDSSDASGPASSPPFFSHHVGLQYECMLSSAFRVRVDADSVTPDGVFTGVGFGVSDGYRVILAGFVQTVATNLSSAMSLANQVKAKYGAHLILTGIHRPVDATDAVDVVDATSLQSLIILLNRMKELFNRHLALGAAGSVHVIPDTVNPAVAPDAVDTLSAVALANAVASAFDAHRVRSDVHYAVDTVNAVALVRQVGILRAGGFMELEGGWESCAADWSQYATYRLVRNPDGGADLFLSGSTSPMASLAAADLPEASSLDLSIDEMEQVLFGALGRQSAATSYWAFVRANISPVNAVQIGDNKSVTYTPLWVPELDPSAPWIGIGQTGWDRVVGAALVSDSTASEPLSGDGLGGTTGAYKGYLRLEPILSDRAVCSIEFRASFQYWTFGVDDRAAGVFVDDGYLSAHLVFLQASPATASVTGTEPPPFGIAAGDALRIVVDGVLYSIDYTGPAPTVAAAAAPINAAVGFALAAASPDGHMRFTDALSGSGSVIQVLSGTALVKLGIPPGTYYGKDSEPEPKVSWFGSDFPSRDVPAWYELGDQPAEMLGRTLRITDADAGDLRAYSLSDPLYALPAIPDASDWKLDARLCVLSYQAGDSVVTGSNLRFCGALVNVDEGPAGKNVELHLAATGGGVPYVSVLTYDSLTDLLNSCAEYPFAWSDGEVHTYNVFTSKLANLVLVLADGALLGSFPYASLSAGAQTSVSFGSGANPVANGDLRTARSVVDWGSVCVFRDSKVADPSSALKRYVGLYAGGDPARLGSYYLAQVDWSSPHTYRMVRDPSGNVSVYLDAGLVPVISVSYDALRLPPAPLSFLAPVTAGRQCVAFGSFSPTEVSRGTWDYVRYSLGRLTVTDRLVPPNHVLNRANVIASPDHLRTKVPHQHFGTRVWSGGTPSDDFMADGSVPAYAVLGEGTPPVPMTRDLASRGGLVKGVTPVMSVAAEDLADRPGFLSSFQDDLLLGDGTHAVVTIADAAAVLNALKANLNRHVADPGSHVQVDPDDAVSLADVPTAVPDLGLTVALANAVRAAYEAHRAKHVLADFAVYPPAAPLEVEIHVGRDTVNVVTAPEATGLVTLVALANDLVVQATAHGVEPGVHGSSVVIRLDPPNGVLYDQMRFWLTETGEEGHVSPFSDDHCHGELWHTGGDPDPSTWTLTESYDGP